MEKNKEYERLTQEQIEFVQQDDKIYDKKLETKPIGYFKDAMIRFRRNRTNLVATSILMLLVLLAVFVPIITNKNYTIQEHQLAYLPPRIPVLEHLGIFDGTRGYSDQTVDRTTIDPETGLGLPIGFNTDLILMDTLDNYTATCTDSIESCVGGENVLSLRSGATSAAIQTRGTINFVIENNPTITVVVDAFRGEDAALDVMVTTNGLTYVVIGTITEPGTHTFDVSTLENGDADFTSQLQLRLTGESGVARAVLNEVTIEDDEDLIRRDSGFSLSNYQLLSGTAGRYARQNGELLLASFKYRAYDAAFGVVERRAFSAELYEQVINQNKDVCTKTNDPENPNAWSFSEGCPITQVVGQSEPEFLDGEAFFTYHLYLDYALYRGYDPENLPYFFFGTTAGGQDFFALVWLGLRTSLLIGVIVAVINISIGVVYGAIEGYYGGTVDLLMERFGEIVGRIPFLVWLALFVIIFGPGVLTLIVLMTVTGWLGVASVTRTQFYRYKGREYVLASRTLGARDSRLIFRHILPNGIGTIITASVLMIPGVIFIESTISYLGYGIGHGQAFNIFGLFELSGVSIGVLLADGRTQLVDKPYLTAFPALIISILMITFNLFGNALRDAFNPSLRGTE